MPIRIEKVLSSQRAYYSAYKSATMGEALFRALPRAFLISPAILVIADFPKELLRNNHIFV
jgi:hypothetical protein